MAVTRLGLYGGARPPYGTFSGRAATTATTSAVTVIFRPMNRKTFYADIMYDMMTKRTLSRTMTITLNLR
jgi:hypothetical protein